MSALKEFRCSNCNKLLGKIDGRAEIVCPRCKILNEFNIMRKPVEDAASCSECEQLWNDDGILRCGMYCNAMIEDTKEKHCKDSIM